MDAGNPKSAKHRKWVGTVLFILFNIAVIAVTAYYDFGKGQNGAHRDLPGINAWYLLAVAGCFAAALAAETVKYYILLKHDVGVTSLRTSFEVAALGKYYDYITPFGAGGQPFQAVYLHKCGVNAGSSTALPIAGFLGLQGAFIFLAVIVLIFSGQIVETGALMIPAYLGLAFYLFIPFLIVIFAIAPTFTERMLCFFLNLFAKMKIVKNPEEKEASVLSTLHDAIFSITSICRNRFLFLKIFLLSLVYQIAVCSMPYFVLRVFGNTLGYIHVFKYCVYIYLCITFIPTPGNAGAAEGSFYALFSVLGQENLFWAMLVWRFFCYYLFIATGFAVTLFGHGRSGNALPGIKRRVRSRKD